MLEITLAFHSHLLIINSSIFCLNLYQCYVVIHYFYPLIKSGSKVFSHLSKCDPSQHMRLYLLNCLYFTVDFLPSKILIKKG